MRIGIVLSQPPEYSETFFRSKIEGLQRNGAEVILFCYQDRKNFTLCPVVKGVRVSRNPLLQSWYFIAEFFQLLPHLSTVGRYIKLERKEGTSWKKLPWKIYYNAHLLKAKLDWLHFGFTTMALGSETVAKAMGAKMAVSFRGFDIAVYPVKHPGCYKLLWKYVDKIHTISDDLLTLAKKHGLSDGVPVGKITPAINVEMFKSSSQDFSQNAKPILMTTGRLHWKKGLVGTVEALAILKEQGFDFVYRIIGEGKEYERIAYAVYQLGLGDNVEFLGKIPHSEVKNHLERADIYLQYSIQEGFCNSVLEAQAMGKLCIVSNAEGLAENVLHNQTGWVVPKYSPELLAKRIKDVLLMSEEERIKIYRNAVERVRKNFNLEKQQREFFEFYRLTAMDTEKAQ